jgi:ribonuclease D
VYLVNIVGTNWAAQVSLCYGVMSSSLLVVEVHRGVRQTTLEIFHLAVIEALLTLPNPSFILCFRKPALVFSQVLGRGERSLAHLLRRHCSIMQDKTHQTADWRVRPLPQQLQTYARSDVHWLPYLAGVMVAEMQSRSPSSTGVSWAW